MISFLGDIHGVVFPIFDWIYAAEKGDTLIQVGDAGVGMISRNNWEDIGKVAEDRGVEIKIIRGNHDDPQPFKENLKFGSLELVPDYSYRTIEGTKFLFIGGAISIDRIWRTEGVDYWKAEGIEFNLDKILEDADIVVTHSFPDFCTLSPRDFSNILWAINKDYPLKNELIEERKYLTEVYKKMLETRKPKIWVGGHFHLSKTEIINNTKFKCLDINELWTLMQ